MLEIGINMANYIRNTIASLVAAASMSGCTPDKLEGVVTQVSNNPVVTVDKYRIQDKKDRCEVRIATGDKIIAVYMNTKGTRQQEQTLCDVVKPGDSVVFYGIRFDDVKNNIPYFSAEQMDMTGQAPREAIEKAEQTSKASSSQLEKQVQEAGDTSKALGANPELATAIGYLPMLKVIPNSLIKSNLKPEYVVGALESAKYEKNLPSTIRYLSRRSEVTDALTGLVKDKELVAQVKTLSQQPEVAKAMRDLVSQKEVADALKDMLSQPDFPDAVKDILKPYVTAS